MTQIDNDSSVKAMLSNIDSIRLFSDAIARQKLLLVVLKRF